jgi:hypothetical protein
LEDGSNGDGSEITGHQVVFALHFSSSLLQLPATP